jgi:hypothetical protein
MIELLIIMWIILFFLWIYLIRKKNKDVDIKFEKLKKEQKEIFDNFIELNDLTEKIRYKYERKEYDEEMDGYIDEYNRKYHELKRGY